VGTSRNDDYAVPCDRIIAVYRRFDIRMVIKQKGIEIFDDLASHGVLSEFLYCSSLHARRPRVPSWGIDYFESYSDISECPAAVDMWVRWR
jgi:hypothetical protein